MSMEILVAGFIVGMTGAIVPGPLLFATIDNSLKNGWKAGPKIFIGHAVLEVLICILIICGITAVNDTVITVISVIGGATLVFFGIQTVRNAKAASGSVHAHGNTSTDPVLTGLLASASNPYFWLWWLAAGSALVLKSLEVSMLAAALFVIGHWFADLGYFTFVAASFSKGKELMSQKHYEWVLVSCGLFLVLFGAWFIVGTWA